MKHTPGPWALDRDKHDPNQLVVRDATGCAVCAPQHFLVDEHFANARLIAAAPTMEKSLAHILVLIQQGVDDQDLVAIEDHCRSALAEAWGIAPDAVGTPDLAEFAKAEGR